MMASWELCVATMLVLAACQALIVEEGWKIYYDLSTNKTIDIIESSNPRLKYYKPGSEKLFRIGFGPIPCSCEGYTCGCCAGMNIQYFNFNQRACMNFSYDPREFAITMNMLMNDESLYAQTVSGKNPPPACLPVPIPYLPSVDMCLKFFNIHTPGYNIFMCMDFETRIERAPVLVLHFDCMQMGSDGVSYHKPEEAEFGPEIEDVDSNVQNAEQEEVYDEVFEEGQSTSTIKTTTTQKASTTTITTQMTTTPTTTSSLPTEQPNKSLLRGNQTNTTKIQVEEVYDEVFEDDMLPANLTEKPDRNTMHWETVTNGEEIYDEVTEDKKSEP